MFKSLYQKLDQTQQLREELIQLNQKIINNEDVFEDFLDEYYAHEDFFISLLNHEDPKVRKNILKLFSKVADPTLMDQIFHKYMEEDIQFLKKDYLIALEKFEYEEKLPQLKEKHAQLLEEPRTKHSIEELRQIQNLIWKVEPPKSHSFVPQKTENLLLIYPRGMETMGETELAQISETKAKKINGGCLVSTQRFYEVASVRTYQALLFDFYPKSMPFKDGHEIGEKIMDEGVISYIKEHHKEEHPFLFRVDVKGISDLKQKNKVAKDLSDYLEEHGEGNLINNSSHYELEIRVLIGKNGSRVFLKMNTFKDMRFKYRKYVTSTSMQPSKAAMIMHYLKPYMKKESTILDPFCGTGTLLIERALSGPCKSLYGLDISEQAIQAAWENSQNAGKSMQYIHRNFNDFTHDHKFQEIITDMPRKNAKIEQRQIRYVYDLLFQQAKNLLDSEGILCVYCEDELLMEEEVKNHRWLRRIKKIPLSSEQTSWLYILHRFNI